MELRNQDMTWAIVLSFLYQFPMLSSVNGRTNNYEMDNFENSEVEFAQEAQTLNDEKDIIEEGLDAARIQISTSKKDDRVQVNEVTSTTKNDVAQPYMDFPFLVDDNTIS